MEEQDPPRFFPRHRQGSFFSNSLYSGVAGEMYDISFPGGSSSSLFRDQKGTAYSM